MKNCLFLATTVLSLMASASAAATIGGIEFPQGAASFADVLVDHRIGSNVSGSYADPFSVLGLPDYSAPTGSFSLGNPPSGTPANELGFVTVQFTDNSLTTSGDDSADLFIFEIGAQVEDFLVEISKDNVSWLSVGVVSGQPTELDIDGVAGVNPGDLFSFVRITDAFGGPSSGSPFGGPDIDAIGAISSAPPDPDIGGQVPLPASAWLLIAAFAGLFGMRRKA